MYEYYKLSPQERQKLVRQRLEQVFPRYSPPHTLQKLFQGG